MIRRASVDDAAKIAALDSKIFKDSLGFEFIYNDLLKNDFAYYFVCEIAGEIIGYINVWISDNTEILNFCVDERYRGRGIGNLLYKEVEKIAFGSSSLEVRVSNYNAIKFYEKRGFVKAFIRKNYYSDGEDAILMIKG